MTLWSTVIGLCFIRSLEKKKGNICPIFCDNLACPASRLPPRVFPLAPTPFLYPFLLLSLLSTLDPHTLTISSLNHPLSLSAPPFSSLMAFLSVHSLNFFSFSSHFLHILYFFFLFTPCKRWDPVALFSFFRERIFHMIFLIFS